MYCVYYSHKSCCRLWSLTIIIPIALLHYIHIYCIILSILSTLSDSSVTVSMHLRMYVHVQVTLEFPFWLSPGGENSPLWMKVGMETETGYHTIWIWLYPQLTTSKLSVPLYVSLFSIRHLPTLRSTAAPSCIGQFESWSGTGCRARKSQSEQREHITVHT